MKNNNLYMKWSFLLISLLLLNSCTDYLKEEPTSGFTADFVYNTPEGLEAGVVGLYTIQRSFWENPGTNNGSDPIVIDAKDDLTVPRGGEISNYGKLSSGRYPTNSGVHGTYWNLYYRIIDRSNAIIKAAATVDMPDARRNQIVAEAKFFRANSVFTLFKLFNNIYVTTEPTTPENALTIINAKTPEADIYKLVKDDLIFAIANLQWNVTAGRVGQGVARHLKAEVALWQSDWLEAKTQSEKVIAQTATHDLATGTDLVFKGEMATKESLWVLQFKKAINGSANKINFNIMPNYAEQTPGSKYTIEQAGRGFGWLTMNNYVRDLLAQSANDTRIKGTYYIKDYVYNDPLTIPTGIVLGSIIRNNPTAPWKEFGTLADRTGFFIRQNAGCRKYFPDDGIPTEDTQVKNIMMARLAETCLYAAEANMRLTNNTLALFYLNKVRTRASTPALTGTVTIENILDEQARELAFEGRRWYMLKRTGKLYAYIVDHAGYGKAGVLDATNTGTHANTAADPFTFANDARRNMQPWMVNWVIPQSQMNLFGPDYPQNTGY